jgi:hypothetical protein
VLNTTTGTEKRRTNNEAESKGIPEPTSPNKNRLFGPAYSSDNAGDGPKNIDKNPPPCPPATAKTPAGQEATNPPNRQATAHEPLTSHTPCTDDSLRLILEKAGILHSLEASGYFGDRTSENYNGRWFDSLVEYHVQKEARDKLELLIPEKLELIQSMIEIKEQQRKLKEWDCHEWICINWNLDRADLQKLRKIKDNLCGQKISLGKLIKIHNVTTADKNKDQSQNNEVPNQPEASGNAKPKATKNAKRNERRRKTKQPKDTPCDRPVRSTQMWDQTFRAPNRPPQPDPCMELEEAAALLNDQYDEEEFTIEESWTHFQIRQIADELMAKERRHRTATTYIRIHELRQQSGKPHPPPAYKHTIYHAHIISYHPPTPPHNPTLLTGSLITHYKGFSPHQQGPLLNKDALKPQSLHTIVLFSPQTLQPARITPRGRGDGPRSAQNGHPSFSA